MSGIQTAAEVSAGEHWDEVASQWRESGPPLWRRHSDAVNLMVLRRWLARPAEAVLKTDLFDEMVGDGLYPDLAAHAQRVVGVDLSEVVVERARRRYPYLEATVADVRNLPFGDGTFCAVLSNSTLDHFAGPSEVVAALVELRRVLRPGGRIVVTLDNPLCPAIAIRNRLPARLARRLRDVPFDSGWTCGPRRLRGLLTEAGYEVEETTAILHAPRAPVAWLDGVYGAEGRRLWKAILACERLERWPTRYLTGHFVVALGVRPPV